MLADLLHQTITVEDVIVFAILVVAIGFIVSRRGR